MNETDQNPDQARLAQALRKLDRERIFVPAAREEAITSRLHSEFAGQFESRTIRPQWRAWLAIAATVMLAALGVWFSLRPGHGTHADLNRDGTVDIMDAFALARRIEAGQGGPDLNGDGRIDSADVEFIAARAVRLKGGRS